MLLVDLPIEPSRGQSVSCSGSSRRNIRSLTIKQGLDLQGGTQILLEAKPSEGQTVTAEDMQTAKTIVERRVNGLGVTEPLVQLQGENRIIVELPGIDNPDQAVQTLKSTGQLEFVEIGPSDKLALSEHRSRASTCAPRTTTARLIEATLGKTEHPYPDKVFRTIMTGRDLKDAPDCRGSVRRARTSASS